MIGVGRKKEPLVHINQFAIKGEKGTGFEEREEKGPFECRNCEYFKNNSCGQEDMMKKSKRPRTPNGRVKVGPLDCCEYIDRTGKVK